MAVLALVVIAIAGWNVWSQLEAPQATSYRFDESKPYPFLDDVASNATPDATGFDALQFQDTKGEPWDLARYRGTRNVVLVITRGRTSGQPAEMHRGRICLYCASQTARLVANHDAIKAHDAEVVVVFPVVSAADRTEVARFTAAVDRDARRHDGVGGATPPFPVVLDVGLGAIERLGLRADLAKPATYVLDKEGRVRFAYVGQSPADRPSVKAIVGQLSALADAPP